MSTARLVNLAGTLEDVKTLLEDRLGLGDRMDRCESDIQVIKKQIGIG